jgi:cyclopropane fatty-acyl-phospholipid synthase-like methyltransferase
VAGGKTLVVADGEGRNSVYLASRGYDVRAKDYSQVAKVKAKALAKEAGVDVDFVLSDIYDAGWSDEAYDNVVAIFIQFVPPERMEEVFTALSRATGAGGTLLIHGYTPEQVALGGGGRAIPTICTHPTCWPMRFRTCKSQSTAPIPPP